MDAKLDLSMELSTPPIRMRSSKRMERRTAPVITFGVSDPLPSSEPPRSPVTAMLILSHSTDESTGADEDLWVCRRDAVLPKPLSIKSSIHGLGSFNHLLNLLTSTSLLP